MLAAYYDIYTTEKVYRVSKQEATKKKIINLRSSSHTHNRKLAHFLLWKVFLFYYLGTVCDLIFLEICSPCL